MDRNGPLLRSQQGKATFGAGRRLYGRQKESPEFLELERGPRKRERSPQAKIHAALIRGIAVINAASVIVRFLEE
jgi:hypothetical protein